MPEKNIKKNSNALSRFFKNLVKKDERNYCIRVKGLNINYGTKKVLDNISFTINNKDVFGIIGLSGSGKTTLLKALMKFTRYEGLIDRADRLGRIGYCPQEDSFFKELSIKENIVIFGNMTSTPINTAIERASKLLKELEVNESIDKTSGLMSGGQRKRLNIVLSILHEPKTIILDEPFAGLDYKNRLILWDFIKEKKREGKTIILTTHLLEEAEDNCNNLLIISGGKKFALGSINDIQRSLRFKEYLAIKFKYLSKEDSKKIIDYCQKRDIWIVESSSSRIGFGLKNDEERENITNMIKRLEIGYEITEYRPPTLNELFMVSINE